MTLVLAYLFGFVGADRFYLGKSRSALVKLFTLGGLGYWWLIDIIITLCGGQRDGDGLRLGGYEKHKKRVWVVIGAVFGASFALGTVALTVTAAFGDTGPTPFGWILLTALAASGVGASAIWLVRFRARNRVTRKQRGTHLTPPRIDTALNRITELRVKYVMHAAAGNTISASVVKQIDSLRVNVAQLFTRLTAKSDKAQRTRAEDEYVDKLGKLAASLDHDYLLDLLINPRFWNDPDQRISDVQSAINAVDAQLIDNIRQINSHRGLVFEVAISGLLGPRKAFDDWQRDFDEASGNE